MLNLRRLAINPRGMRLLLFFPALFFYGTCVAQQPGGVPGTKAWYVTKADKSNYLTDKAGTINKPIKSKSTLAPNRNINFNPATYFGANALDTITISNFDSNELNYVGIFYPEKGSMNSLFSVESSSSAKLKYKVQTGAIDTVGYKKYLKYGSSTGGNNFEYTTAANAIETAMKPGIFSFPWLRASHSAWGRESSLKQSILFKGYIPELIIYERALSKQQINQVQSYLSIKYGTTLEGSYYSSKGEVIWDKNDNLLKKFHNRVCAIGKDSISGLFQPKSNTTYEDNDYPAYFYSSDSSKTASVKAFVPSTDRPSLFRSLTIGFTGAGLAAVGENQFLFWGDDNGKIKLDSVKTTAYKADKAKYPALQVIHDRKWLLYNKDNLKAKTKVVIAGADYQKSPSLFNQLYDAYDYQRFRYLMLKIKGDSLVEAKLNSYFGREWFGAEKFSTRTIVWDSVGWDTKNTDKQLFTFGRVPVLNILEIGKSTDKKLLGLNYPYRKSQAIGNVVQYDTLKTIYQLKAGEKLAFTVPAGLVLTEVNLKVLNKGEWKLIAGKPVSNGTTELTDSTAISGVKTVATLETDNPAPSLATTSPITDYSEIQRQMPFIAIRKKYYLSSTILLETNSFLIEIRDNLGQLTTLPFKTQKIKAPKAN